MKRQPSWPRRRWTHAAIFLRVASETCQLDWGAVARVDLVLHRLRDGGGVRAAPQELGRYNTGLVENGVSRSVAETPVASGAGHRRSATVRSTANAQAAATAPDRKPVVARSTAL